MLTDDSVVAANMMELHQLWGFNDGAWRIPHDESGNWTSNDDNVQPLACDDVSTHVPMFNDVQTFKLRTPTRIRESALRALPSTSTWLMPASTAGYIEDSRGICIDLETNAVLLRHILSMQATKLDEANVALLTCESEQAQAKRQFIEAQHLALEAFIQSQSSCLAKHKATVASMHQDSFKIMANFQLFTADALRQSVVTTSDCITNLNTMPANLSSAPCHAPVAADTPLQIPAARQFSVETTASPRLTFEGQGTQAERTNIQSRSGSKRKLANFETASAEEK